MNKLAHVNKILIILVVVVLYWGAPFLIPFIFGIFFAFFLVPLCNLLEKIRLHHILASLLSTLTLFIVFGGTLFLFTIQFNSFVNDKPSIEDKVESFFESSQNKIESLTNITLGEQNKILKERSGDIIEKAEPIVTRFFGNMFGSIVSFVLILVYVFLLLLYRDRIYDFLLMYISKDNKNSAKNTFSKIGKVVFGYICGRTQVMILLGIMFFITFIYFGLPYALLFALFGAVITIIPYIGTLIRSLLPLLFSLVYFDSFQKILIFSGVIIVIQLFESYVLEPLIFGKEVQLNPLVIILAIVLGGIILGLAGMILFVSIVAMVKIVSLNHSELKPIGFFLGQDEKEEFENN